MKFNFKKIASVLTGAVMLSSTVALAAAANYPAPFIKSAGGDVAIVYGANAAPTDFAAVVEINSHLTSELAKMTSPASSTTASSGTTVTGGDYVKLSKPANAINLRDTVSDVYGSTLTKTDLPVLLSNEKYINDENNNYDYEQRISLGSALRLEYFSDSDYKDRKPSVGINLTTSQVVLNYSLDFTSNPESDVVSGDLVDLETTTIKILGKEYYISDFDNISASGTGTITLLDTANSAIVKDGGEAVTVKVNDKSYDVSVVFLSTSETKLSVNGEVTNSLSEGATYKLSDGTYVGIKDILARDVAGAIGSVEFSLGSGKLELRGGQSIRLNDVSIPEVTTEIARGSAASSGRETIDRINLAWTTDEDTFLTSESDLTIPGFKNIKLSMSDLVRGSGETTVVREGASDYIVLETVLKDGAVTIPLLYADAGGEFAGIGKSSSDRLVTTNGTLLTFNYTAGDRTFIATYNTSTYAESYYLQLTGFTNDNGINKTTIQKRADGNWVDACKDRRNGDTCTIGSLTLTISTISAHPDRTVNMTGNAGSSFSTLYTKGGLKIFMPFPALNESETLTTGAFNATARTVGKNSSRYDLIFDEEDRTDTLGGGNAINVNLSSNTDNEVEVVAFEIGRSTVTNPDDSDHVSGYVYSDLGTYVERKGKSSDQREATLKYSGSESFADVFLTTGNAVVSKAAASNTTSTTTSSSSVKVLGSVAVSDAEVAQVSGKNLIVVGGSCINKVAAELLGGPLCGSDFEAKTGVGNGQFLIQTFTRTGDKVATLVAGYNAGDTSNAAKYFITQPVDTTVGKKYKGTSATSATLVTETTATPAANATK